MQRLKDYWLRVRQGARSAAAKQIARGFETDTADLETLNVPWFAVSVIYAVLLLLVIGAGWAHFGKVDVVVVAPGRIVTTAPLAVVQPLETSIISSILVAPGDSVKKGQILANLEPTFQNADFLANQEQESALRAQIKRLKSELGTENQNIGADQDGYEHLEQQLEVTRREEYEARVSRLQAAIIELLRKLDTTKNEQAGLGEQLGSAKKLASISEQLADNGAGTLVAVIEGRERIAAIALKLRERGDHAREIEARLEQARQELFGFEQSWRREVIGELVSGVKELREADHTGDKLKLRSNLVFLRAPTNGTVMSIAKRSVGSVLREAEEFITIVPSNSALEAEIRIEPSDIGHVHVGDSVVLKFNAYPYTRYGSMRGTVRWISPDGVTSQDESQPVVFFARIQLNEDSLGAKFPIHPGFTLVADVLVGRRSILSYLLEPLKMTWKEAMREP